MIDAVLALSFQKIVESKNCFYNNKPVEAYNKTWASYILIQGLAELNSFSEMKTNILQLQGTIAKMLPIIKNSFEKETCDFNKYSSVYSNILQQFASFQLEKCVAP